MAKDKTQDQIVLELENLEIPGNQNPWQKKDSRYTNSILNEAAGTEFSSQALSNIIRRDQDILEGVQNRTSMVIAVQSQATDYEKIKFNSNKEKDNPGDVNNLNKVYTRNAESKNYFLKAPWKYDNSTLGMYKSFISTELHTSTIRSVAEDGEQSIPGDFIDVLYEDQTQDTAKFVRKKKTGIEAFPQFFSSQSTWVTGPDMWPGNDNSIISKPDSPKKKGASKLPSLKAWEGKPEKDSIVEEIKQFWSPIFAPVASLAGETIRSSSRFGPRKLGTDAEMRWHKGIDLNINKDNRGAGNPIVAIADGVVVRVGMDGKINPPSPQQPKRADKIGYITIEHDLKQAPKQGVYQVRTRYMHLFLIGEKSGGGRLSKGDVVKAGDVLGYMGGRPRDPGAGKGSTGIHLHFEVLVSKMINGIKEYDSYSLGVNQGTGEEKMEFAGESTVGAKGAVNPLFFDYPNQLNYSADAEAGILQQLPKDAAPAPESTTATGSSAPPPKTDAAKITPPRGG